MKELMRVLFIENDDVFIEKLLPLFKKNNIHVEVAYNGEEGLLKLNYSLFDVILLDYMLPDVDGKKLDGKSIVQIIRQRGYQIPIVMLSALYDVENKTELINCGADDYIVKPCYFSEVLARLKAAHRRVNYKTCNNIATVGRLKIDISNKDALIDDISLGLTDKEYKMLELLIKNKGKLVPKEMFMKYLYEDSEINHYDKSIPRIKIVDVFMCKLRKKIKNVAHKDYIATSWGSGYKIANIKEDEEENSETFKLHTMNN